MIPSLYAACLVPEGDAWMVWVVIPNSHPTAYHLEFVDDTHNEGN